jgi:hypothetical protein
VGEERRDFQMAVPSAKNVLLWGVGGPWDRRGFHRVCVDVHDLLLPLHLDRAHPTCPSWVALCDDFNGAMTGG